MYMYVWLTKIIDLKKEKKKINFVTGQMTYMYMYCANLNKYNVHVHYKIWH